MSGFLRAGNQKGAGRERGKGFLTSLRDRAEQTAPGAPAPLG